MEDDFNLDDLDAALERDALEETLKEIQDNYRVDIVTPDALERLGEGEENDAWANDHIVRMLAHDKAECRALGRRMLHLWHLEDPSVTSVNLEVLNLHSNYLLEYTIELPEDER